MTDTATELKVTAASDIEVDRDTLDASIKEFAEVNGDYYVESFHQIHDNTSFVPKTFNIWAAVLGPLWASSRAIWGMFWGFLILEIIAWVQIGRGLWGTPGSEFLERAAKQAETMQRRLDQAAAATEQADIDRFTKLADNMQRAIDTNLEKVEQAQAEATGIMITGIIMLLIFKVIQGLYANTVYEKQYSRWRIEPDSTESGRSNRNAILGAVLTVAIAPLVIYRFTVNATMDLLTTFPERQLSEYALGEGNGTFFSVIASWMEARIDAAAIAGGDVFDGIVSGVRSVLDGLTIALNDSPWPVVMLVIAVVAWRSAGPRVAIFTVASMAYMSLLGYWALAMETLALVGAAVLLCVVIGIPLGIWFGKSRRAYRMAEPVLDLMQTLPAFVYLIPIIAFFGTGNPPGILATIIFGMPPVIRLTALGMRGVPESIKEAADAFGATRWQKLKDVEIPLALPSIMAGVNQTILMCLSMVVIISLIGGGGLGQEILEALQYAAKGPGLLGGFAILFLAMVMDRVVQGAFKRQDQKE
ncbi:ABC transporter permease [Roseovarius sp. 2305UL8-3]|uniref:ABC transporter permease n=1 Tax=Roseovarius conchicola TaxID=3121636 RepID=UPI0035294E13